MTARWDQLAAAGQALAALDAPVEEYRIDYDATDLRCVLCRVIEGDSDLADPAQQAWPYGVSSPLSFASVTARGCGRLSSWSRPLACSGSLGAASLPSPAGSPGGPSDEPLPWL